MHKPSGTLVWDLPLRVWHWAFGLCIGGSVYTGLSGEISLLERHQQLGYCMLGLLLFRVGWGFWGGRYARFRAYRVSPRALTAHFRGAGAATPHTAPGAAMAMLFMALVAAQTATGLFATDDIFTEGPLTRHVQAATASNMTWVHHRVFWLILLAVAVHLAAQVVYAWRGDRTPLAMFTGRKPVSVASTSASAVAAVLTAAAAAGLVWAFLAWV